MFTTIWNQRIAYERGPSRMRAALLVAAGLLLTEPARAMMLPRDPARLAAVADYDVDAAAAAAASGVTKKEDARLLQMLLLRVMQERRLHQQDEHDAVIDAALEAAGPLLEAADIGGGAGRTGDVEHAPPHAPDDKRNFRALVPTLCHFKICNMGRKRNSPPEAGAAAWSTL